MKTRFCCPKNANKCRGQSQPKHLKTQRIGFEKTYRSFHIRYAAFGVSKRLLCSIRLVVYYLPIVLADHISRRSYVGSVFRMWSLAFSGF